MCALLYRLRTLFFSITQPEKRERHVHVPSSNTSHSDATSCDTHTHRPGLAHQEPKTKRESQGTKRHNACRPKGSSQAHGTIHRFSKKPSKNRKKRMGTPSVARAPSHATSSTYGCEAKADGPAPCKSSGQAATVGVVAMERRDCRVQATAFETLSPIRKSGDLQRKS